MKKRVLIVEDEPWQADVFKRQLEEHYEVVTVINGHTAIDAIDAKIPDVIILDLLLAGSTGLTLVHELKSHDDLANIPIVLITNLAEVVSSDVAMHYGIYEVIDKSLIRPRDIRTIVDRAAA